MIAPLDLCPMDLPALPSSASPYIVATPGCYEPAIGIRWEGRRALLQRVAGSGNNNGNGNAGDNNGNGNTGNNNGNRNAGNNQGNCHQTDNNGNDDQGDENSYRDWQQLYRCYLHPNRVK